MERFISLCIVQHVHDNDLKALFFDFERMLSLSRFDEDDVAARSVVQSLVVLSVLMPFDAEQQAVLHRLPRQYSRYWKYMPDYRCASRASNHRVGASSPASSTPSCCDGPCQRSRRWSDTPCSRGSDCVVSCVATCSTARSRRCGGSC